MVNSLHKMSPVKLDFLSVGYLLFIQETMIFEEHREQANVGGKNILFAFKGDTQACMCEGWLKRMWPNEEGDQLYSSCYMRMQVRSLSDYTESLKLKISDICVLGDSTSGYRDMLSSRG